MHYSLVMKGILQKGMHAYDVYTHLLVSCDFAERNLVIRLAALFHDIGKPDVLDKNDFSEPTFYNHEKVSSGHAHNILSRLKFPKNIEFHVCHLIEHHMFSYSSDWTDSAIRRFISRVGKEYLDDLLLLRSADSSGITGKRHHCPYLDEMKQRISYALTEKSAVSLKDLDIDGNILAEEGGIPKGPEMGYILNYLLETVLDDPALNKRDKLLLIAKKYYNKHMKV